MMISQGNRTNVVHISDLHLGEIDQQTGAAIWDPHLLSFWQVLGPLTGFFGHTMEAMADAEELYQDIEEEGDPTRILVSGDLTRCGKPVEFSSVDNWLARSVTHGGVTTGMNLGSNWKSDAIPGNHDHWPGSTAHFFNHHNATVVRYMRHYPRLLAPIAVGGRTLTLCALNTDADVSNFQDRIQARGSFVSQCAHAIQLFGPASKALKSDTRGLLLHHSPAQAGVQMGIDRPSKDALDSLIDASAVRVIFTGHCHRAGVFRHQTGAGTRYYELRCGTTCQLDHLPVHLMHRFPAGMHRPLARHLQVRNSAVVHRLEDQSAGLKVVSEIYERTPPPIPHSLRPPPSSPPRTPLRGGFKRTTSYSPIYL